MCNFLQTIFLSLLNESGASEPFTKEMPQEVNQDTYETREER
jgi:hypothetical protein